jgi:hypothetical protein
MFTPELLGVNGIYWLFLQKRAISIKLGAFLKKNTTTIK